VKSSIARAYSFKKIEISIKVKTYAADKAPDDTKAKKTINI